ncbi:MAG: hypothetical protein KJT01_08705 [Gemmatimonadetes bacterium]|nr:hypothetical protein [Gemmatimonadota bacterium]
MRRRHLLALGVALLAPLAIAARALPLPLPQVNLTGTWAFTVVTDNGTGTPTVTITQKGDSLTGTYESARSGSLPFKGTVRDTLFTFTTTTPGGITYLFTGAVVDANTVKGTMELGGMGSASFTGTRKPAPGR